MPKKISLRIKIPFEILEQAILIKDKNKKIEEFIEEILIEKINELKNQGKKF